MKGFNKWLSEARETLNSLRHLYKMPELGPIKQNGDITFLNIPIEKVLEKVPPNNTGAEKYIRMIYPRWNDYNAWLEVWAITSLAGSGIKCYAPSPDECESLINVEINIQWKDFKQPFETFAVALPDGSVFGGDNHAVGVFSTYHSSTNSLTITVITSSEMSGQSVIIDCDRHVGETIESTLFDESNFRDYPRPKSQIVWPVRVAMNAMLLLTNFGTRPLGYANPEYAARLQEKLKNKKIPEHIQSANRDALAMIPQVYGIEQDIRLYDTEGGSHDPSDPTGRHCKPHWRRGHWARVACGAGRIERRLIFRRPVMVHADRFAGDISSTRAVYSKASI